MADSIIHIGDFGIAKKQRGFYAARAEGLCLHRQVELDDHGHTCKCIKCGETVSPYWFLHMLASDWERAERTRQEADDKLRADLKANLTLIAARRVEEAWRKRKMLPCCPHCHRGISPHDGFGGSMVSKAIEQRRRENELAGGKYSAARPMPKESPNG